MNKPGSCKETNITYEIQCVSYQLEEGVTSKYHGETHRSFWDRIREHQIALKNRDNKNALVAHWETWHKDKEDAPLYKYKVSKICHNSLER